MAEAIPDVEEVPRGVPVCECLIYVVWPECEADLDVVRILEDAVGTGIRIVRDLRDASRRPKLRRRHRIEPIPRVLDLPLVDPFKSLPRRPPLGARLCGLLALDFCTRKTGKCCESHVQFLQRWRPVASQPKPAIPDHMRQLQELIRDYGNVLRRHRLNHVFSLRLVVLKLSLAVDQ